MKKILIFILVLTLMSFAVLAQGKGVHEPGTGLDNPEVKQAGQETGQGQQIQTTTINQGAEQQIKTQQKSQVRAQNTDQLKSMIQEKKQQMDKALQGLSEKQKNIYKNQNQVRLAVHSLLAMEDLTGGIGPQVSQVARNLNNSIQKTIKTEEQIRSKGGFARFFTGGDAESAKELETEVTQNQQKIQELKQLREQCECAEEVKQMMQEQVQNMEKEQQRIQELAQKEKKSKGLFGWIWK